MKYPQIHIVFVRGSWDEGNELKLIRVVSSDEAHALERVFVAFSNAEMSHGIIEEKYFQVTANTRIESVERFLSEEFSREFTRADRVEELLAEKA